MRFTVSKVFGKLRAHGRRIVAGMCMLGAAAAVMNVLPGEAALANSPADVFTSPLSTGPNMAFVSDMADVEAYFNQMYFEAEAESSVVISKQYSNIHFENETIPGSVTYVNSDYLPAGAQQTVIYGSDTIIQYEVADIVTDSGIEQMVLEETEISTMKDSVVLVGTGKSTMAKYAKGFSAESVDPETGVMTVNVEGEQLNVKGVINVRATAYCACTICCGPAACGITSTGTRAKVGTVAVDPKVIPYGTKLFIVANDGSYVYGYSVAEDCGGAIKSDRVDLFYETHWAALQFGRRDCTVYILA